MYVREQLGAFLDQPELRVGRVANLQSLAKEKGDGSILDPNSLLCWAYGIVSLEILRNLSLAKRFYGT